MNRFIAIGRGMLAAAWAAGAVFAAGAAAQTEPDTAYVPFRVNVNATVSAALESESGVVTASMQAIGGATDTLKLYAPQGTGVRSATGGRAAAAAAISARNGKIAVNLPARAYENAEVALYAVNGKRVLRRNAPAAGAAGGVTRLNIAAGAYLLSVKGPSGAAATSRLTHSGGGLEIRVAFVDGSEPAPVTTPLTKKTADAQVWRITVSAPGFADSAYSGAFAAGRDNPVQVITLRAEYEFVEIGGLKWMKKNLDVATSSSWCYEDNNSNCNAYGRLYTWEAAKSACQSVGWRLPDTADWNRLVEAAGGQNKAGNKLKSTSGWYNNGNGTDEYGFSALPGGGRGVGGNFYDAGSTGYWWVATEYADGYAYSRRVYYDSGAVNNGSNINKNLGNSVRCVAD